MSSALAGGKPSMREDLKCSICDKNQWSAEWLSKGGHFFICYQCALQVLPVLFADATFHPQRDAVDLIMTKFSSVYWRAVALNERLFRKHDG